MCAKITKLLTEDLQSFFCTRKRKRMTEQIGIIAGSGQFPRLVAEGARASGLGVVICGFLGHTDTALADVADAFLLLHLGQFNKVIEFFRAHHVSRLCMAGAISKPRALDLRPDFRAVKLLFSMRGKGDDALLRTILQDLENEGFRVQSASDLAPDLHCPAGVLGRVAPSEEVRAALSYGWPIVSTMGRLDIGQCVVVREGMVVAVECLEGTDATLKRGGELGGTGCVALKMSKPGQEKRVDLPSVGFETIRLVTELGYAALIIEARNTLFFDRSKALALADAHGLCVLALSQDESTALQSSQR